TSAPRTRSSWNGAWRTAGWSSRRTACRTGPLARVSRSTTSGSSTSATRTATSGRCSRSARAVAPPARDASGALVPPAVSPHSFHSPDRPNALHAFRTLRGEGWLGGGGASVVLRRLGFLVAVLVFIGLAACST